MTDSFWDVERMRTHSFNKAIQRAFLQFVMDFLFVGMGQLRGSGFKSILLNAINC